MQSVRQTLKPLQSRKTFLVDQYTNLLRSNKVVLALHNSTLLLKEDRALRNELQRAGAHLTVVRSNLMKVALRGINSSDPAAYKPKKTPGVEPFHHPLAPLFAGPSAVITLPELDPKAVDKVVQIIDKSQSKLILLGGQVSGIPGAMFRKDIDVLSKLPTLPELHAQLAGVLTILGGAGLTQTLEASQQKLVLSLQQHASSEPSE